LLKQRIEIPNFQRIIKAKKFRNICAHLGENPDFRLTARTAIESVTTFKEFEAWFLTIKLPKAKPNTEFVTETKNSPEKTNSTSTEHVPPFPPPPDVSYHPSFYVSREAEETKIASCLLHSEKPLIVQGPALFGKRAIISNLLKEIAHSLKFILITYNTKTEKCSLAENPATSLNPSVSRVISFRGLIDVTYEQLLKNAPTILVIENIEFLLEEDLRLLIDKQANSKFQEGSYNKSWLILTTSEPATYLNKYFFYYGYNAVYLAEFDKSQIRQLVELHGFQSSTDTIDMLHKELGGHPYLLRALLYEAVVSKSNIGELFSSPALLAQSIQFMAKIMGRPYSDSLFQLHKNQSFENKQLLERMYKYGFLDEKFSPRAFVVSKVMKNFFDLSYFTVIFTPLHYDNRKLLIHVPIFDNYFVKSSDFNEAFAENFTICYDGTLQLEIKEDMLCITMLAQSEEQEKGTPSGIIIVCIDLLYDISMKIPNETVIRIGRQWFNVNYSKGYKAQKPAEEAEQAEARRRLEVQRAEEAQKLEVARKAEEARLLAEAERIAAKLQQQEEIRKEAEAAKQREEASRIEALREADEIKRIAEAKRKGLVFRRAYRQSIFEKRDSGHIEDYRQYSNKTTIYGIMPHIQNPVISKYSIMLYIREKSECTSIIHYQINRNTNIEHKKYLELFLEDKIDFSNAHLDDLYELNNWHEPAPPVRGPIETPPTSSGEPQKRQKLLELPPRPPSPPPRQSWLDTIFSYKKKPPVGKTIPYDVPAFLLRFYKIQGWPIIKILNTDVPIKINGHQTESGELYYLYKEEEYIIELPRHFCNIACIPLDKLPNNQHTYSISWK
jgi:hypothetical protein